MGITREPFIAHSELTNEIYIVVGKEKYCVTEQAIKAVMAIKALEQEPKSEWEQDHAILKAHSDGANEVLDKIRAEIEQEIIPRNSDQYDHEALWQNMGLRMALKVIDKYKGESGEI